MLSSPESLCSAFRWSVGTLFLMWIFSSQDFETEMTLNEFTEGFKRDYYYINLMPVLRDNICSSINCTGKTIFSLFLIAKSPNMQARPSLHDMCYMSDYQLMILPPYHWKVCKQCCRLLSTSLVLMLWLWEKKQTCPIKLAALATAGPFPQLKWLLTPNLLQFLSSGLQNEGREERKRLSSQLWWQELPQEIAWHCLPETKGLGKKDSPSRMWEDISLSRAILFCDFAKTTTSESRVLFKGTVLSRCKMFQLWENKAASQLCLQPATTSIPGLL